MVKTIGFTAAGPRHFPLRPSHGLTENDARMISSNDHRKMLLRWVVDDYKPMSTTLKEASPCPNCGRPLPLGALAGLCPACLLAQGFPTDAGGPEKPGRFEAPPRERIAALFPQLEVHALIGTGGMGAVYKARQPSLDRWVALKVLPTDGPGGALSEERFNREARALARLGHPNIVGVHEFGQVGGLHYFIMEFVDGANLRQLGQAGRLSPREALQLIPQICDALQYAHDEGVVHRDIKPENVLVDRKGRVKIADFGLAKILGADPAAARLTMEGQVMGTPHYMAPEQVERPLSVDHRADIYSLGVVFYELLTGDLPLGKFLPPSRKVQVDVRLDEIVMRALENDPARRYQHASEVKSGVASVTGTPPPGSGGGPPTDPCAKLAPGKCWWKAVTPVRAAITVWLLVAVIIEFCKLNVPLIYHAKARINVVARVGDGGMMLPAPLDQSSVEAALGKVKSRAVLDLVVDRLNLKTRWAHRSENGRLSDIAAAMSLGSMLTARQFRSSNIIEIECMNESANEAAEVANVVAEAFIDLSRDPASKAAAGVELIDSAQPPLRGAVLYEPHRVVACALLGSVFSGAAAIFVGSMRRRAGIGGPTGDARRQRLAIWVASVGFALLAFGIAFFTGALAGIARR